MDNPLKSSARAQVAAIAAGTLKAERLMEDTLDRVAQANPALNALVYPADELHVLGQARAVDREGPKGPLSGIPTALKDLANARGLPTSHGSPLHAGEMPAEDDPHVARLREAGMIFIGKTNTPEFGLGSHTYNPVHGPTGNPYAPHLTCGGSSGGAAVVLAAGMMNMADGSDMMGSLRNPAGWCNVYGMRPTWGAVPGAAGGDPFLHRLSTRGPMARSPDDLALMLDVMIGAAPGGPLEAKAEVNIGWLADWGGAYAMEPGILDLCECALGDLADAGAKVSPVAPPLSRDVIWEAWTDLRSFSLASDMGPMLDDPATRAQIKPEAVWEIERGLALSAMEVSSASQKRGDWNYAAANLFENFDVLALPTAQVWPFALETPWPREIAGQEMDTYHRWMEVVLPASLLGLPAVAVPAGFGEGGLPMGLQLIGPPGSDTKLLQLAEAYHRATGWPNRKPPEIQ